MDFTVTLVGAGNMGGAMLKGWIANGMSPDGIHVIDPGISGDMKTFLENRGIRSSPSGEADVQPDVLLVAVKPQMMADVLPTLGGSVGENTVIVSVAAGTRIETIASHFANSAIVRTMPNTPSLVARGMTVACPNAKVTAEQQSRVTQLLQAIGRIEWVDDEALIDAVTAVSGSGPAYVFHLAECMAEAGKAAGLPEDLAMILARETVSGAGELLRQSEEAPATLRKNVTSPGGTTAAALDVLMNAENGMPDLLVRAIRAARDRSKELS